MGVDVAGQGAAGAGDRIAERLAGRKVLLTGVTGFVGEALLHLLLTEVPGVTVVALVRPQGQVSAGDRLRALLTKPIFAEVVETAGGVDALVANRIEVLQGDLMATPRLPEDLDSVVHCAGDVSFDAPVDEAFTTNVLGVQALLSRVAEVGPHVHYVHISTAYVAGRRRGLIPEGPLQHDVDLEAEVAWGRSQRSVIENRSRSADLLARFRTKAEKEHRRAGMLTAAAAAERRRRDWVREELVRVGTERARSLGWTDTYTFTKALGERVVEAYAVSAPVSVIRPSIIESALERPYPGWIEGFKMADPLILAYGRGDLPEFPAAADTIVDIVPVDQVAATIVAALARRPGPGEPEWFHVSSSGRNPLSFIRLHDVIRRYFELHPLEVDGRGAARLPDWGFPGADAVERLLVGSERAHGIADYLVSHAPRGDRTRRLAQQLGRQQRRLEFLRRYHDLYREYARCEMRFSDTRTQALYEAMHPADREIFRFDTSQIDWDHYLGEVHTASVSQPVRLYEEARQATRRSGNRPSPVADSAGAAFFDMDGTLLSSNVIETYLWMRLQELDERGRFAHLGRVAARLPGLVRLERQDRSEFLRRMYREYSGARLADLEQVVDEVLASHVLARLSPAGVRRVREHRAAGQRAVLITGAIRPLTRPLAPLFDHIEAADLAVDDQGVCTGFLDAPPLVGESRAAWMRHWADENGFDLATCFAYADSHSDLPMLLAVGNPVAVRPDITLFRHAKKSHWPIVDWSSPPATPRILDPAAGSR